MFKTNSEPIDGLPAQRTGDEETATEATFRSIVEQIASGDERGETRLITTFQTGLRWFLARQVGAEAAKDLVQEVLLDTITAIRDAQIKEPARLAGFVRAIARRKVYRQIDGYCAERRRFVDDGLGLPIRSNSPTPEESALERERIDLAARVLREMNPRDREILTRFYLQEQTQEQICAGMAINATQFRLLKSRAKARFGDLGKERERLPRTLRMKRLATA